MTSIPVLAVNLKTTDFLDLNDEDLWVEEADRHIVQDEWVEVESIERDGGTIIVTPVAEQGFTSPIRIPEAAEVYVHQELSNR